MTLWVRQKKPTKSVITLNPENVDGVRGKGDNIGDSYMREEMPFKTLMTEFFEVSDSEELIHLLFAHNKTQVGKHRIFESGFTLE